MCLQKWKHQDISKTWDHEFFTSDRHGTVTCCKDAAGITMSVLLNFFTNMAQKTRNSIVTRHCV